MARTAGQKPLEADDSAMLERLQEISIRNPCDVPREWLLRLLKLCGHDGSNYYVAVKNGTDTHSVFGPGLRELIKMALREQKRRPRRGTTSRQV
jgi:hypothetical protein